jgi:hypothetical protein
VIDQKVIDKRATHKAAARARLIRSKVDTIRRLLLFSAFFLNHQQHRHPPLPWVNCRRQVRLPFAFVVAFDQAEKLLKLPNSD